MGLIIDYLDQEKERLQIIVAESRKVKSYITLFIESTQHRKQQFQVRKEAILTEIATSEGKAIAIGKRRSFREKVALLRAAINNLQRDLYQLIDDYYEKIQGCADSDTCERVRIGFNEAYDDMLSGFEGIVLDFKRI